MKYSDNLKEIIDSFQKYCSPGEFISFQIEANRFIDNLSNLSVSEQSRQFMERFGHIYQIVNDDKQTTLIRSINKKVKFFYVLAIIWVILMIIALFYYWYNY
jgi:hypothetical protein